MRAQTILFLSVDGVKEKLDCRPYRGGGEGQWQETTRGCKPRLFKPVEFLDLTSSDGRQSDPSKRIRRAGDSSDRKSTRLNSSHLGISYAVFCLKKKKQR